jgi:hypothetical protein
MYLKKKNIKKITICGKKVKENINHAEQDN